MLSFRPRARAELSGAPEAGATPARAAGGFVWLALALAAVVVGLLLFNNRQYLFHTEIYESSDWAANSLFVREAKHSVLLHGHYSRWGFYHPGPVLFYVYGLGEAVCYDWLHIVPTPFNGQVIALCVAGSLFFSFALAVFARRLEAERGGIAFFLPLALLFAVWHYGHAVEVRPFMETWPACPPVLVFLCLLVASAAVASGTGTALPLVAAAGGWLVHNYVAQPLFVVPLTLLAYAGLLVSCRRLPDERESGRRFLTAGWRAFPRPHLCAGGIVLLFVLPVLVDMLRGNESNFSHILAHLRTNHEPPKRLLRSFCYLLTFGSYTRYNPLQDYFGSYSAAGMLAFLKLHWRAYLCWAVTLVAPPVLFAVSRRRGAAVTAEALAVQGGEPSTFIPWFYAVTALAGALTLVWGTKQDGNMFYFNAYFDYSLYYCLALGLAAALAVFLQALTAGSGLVGARAVVSATLWAGLAAAAVDAAPYFEEHTLDLAPDRAAARVVAQAAAATLTPNAVCFLDWGPGADWSITVAVALQLDRLGYRVRVNENWATMFGSKRVLQPGEADFSKPIVRWRVVPIAQDPTRLGRWPVLAGCGIEVPRMAEIDPAGTSRITFSGEGNYTDYAYYGWSPTTGGWTWSDEHNGLLQFRALPLPPEGCTGVDMLINAWSFGRPSHVQSQRLEFVFNGTALETVHLPVTAGDSVIRVHIDAKLWQDAVARGFAKVLFKFPDATSPKALNMGDDSRLLGGAFHAIEFQPAR